MTKPSRESLDAYFAQADSWAHDRQDALRASRRIAWIVAITALVVVVLEALALVFLMPLKTVVPYTLMVDKETGFVQVLKPLDPQLVSSDAALTQSFLVQYVIAREGYDANALQSDYRKVALWSAGDARSNYLAYMQASSPESPLALYPRTTVVEVRVKSVTALAKNVSMVRYATQRHDAGGADRPLRHWVAVISYSYSGAPMTVEDRFVNPLGFQVLRYRRSIETLPEPAPTAPNTPLSPRAPAVVVPNGTVVVPAQPTALPGNLPPAMPRPLAPLAPPNYPRTTPSPAATFRL